jgi:hypothetical protein
MLIEAEPSVQLLTCAATLTVFGPSTTLLLTNMILNATELWPLVSDTAGTINLEESLELNSTVNLAATGVEMLTRPALTKVPAPSDALAGNVTDNVAVSLS